MTYAPFTPERRAKIAATTPPGRRWTLGGKNNRWLGICQEDPAQPGRPATGDAALVKTPDGRGYALVRSVEEVRRLPYRVAASFMTEEGNSDDPGSFVCECPFSGMAHRHFQQYVASVEEAIALGEAAWAAVYAGRAPRGMQST